MRHGQNLIASVNWLTVLKGTCSLLNAHPLSVEDSGQRKVPIFNFVNSWSAIFSAQREFFLLYVVENLRPPTWHGPATASYPVVHLRPASHILHFAIGLKTQSIFPPGLRVQSPYFSTFVEPRNRFQGMNSASLCSLAGRYDNPIPTRFPAPIDCLKTPALVLINKQQHRVMKHI